MAKTKVFLIVAAMVAVGAAGYLVADTTEVGLRASANAPIMSGIPSQLPQVTRGPMTIESVGEAQSQLFFDDGACDSGLGAGTTVTDLVDFDVPTQCIQGGLEVVAVTNRVNTGTMTAFAWAQAGATPPPIAGMNSTPITPVPGIGPCPTQSTFFTQRILPAGLSITGTANFFAGVKGNAYNGRDGDSTPAGRIWLLCATCGQTQYSPAFLTGFGPRRQLDDSGDRRGRQLRPGGAHGVQHPVDGNLRTILRQPGRYWPGLFFPASRPIRPFPGWSTQEIS